MARAFEVGRRVLAAVRSGEFYVITHAEARAGAARRHDEVMAAFDRAMG